MRTGLINFRDMDRDEVLEMQMQDVKVCSDIEMGMMIGDNLMQK